MHIEYITFVHMIKEKTISRGYRFKESVFVQLQKVAKKRNKTLTDVLSDLINGTKNGKSKEH